MRRVNYVNFSIYLSKTLLTCYFVHACYDIMLKTPTIKLCLIFLIKVEIYSIQSFEKKNITFIIRTK